ncbi:nickel pincer cofactor biosynthesis protein LarB [bacterium]|nr:nickel pincer cofactor biosynthesis protein LarB [bacterium]
MNREQLKDLLTSVQSGRMSIDTALEQIKNLPYDDLGFAKIDTHRSLRRGFPEVIFCQGKTTGQIRDIAKRMSQNDPLILGMRASEEQFKAVKTVTKKAVYHPEAKVIVIGKIPRPIRNGLVLIVSAGTADIPVAEEASITAEAMGNPVERLFDAGVAGIHRILNNHEKLIKANVIIVVAGMEGALPGVVAGLLDKPVIAVPTSVGYGASFNGLSALLTMLNSCAPGIGVVNINNGFGAGYLASLINQLGEKT